MEKPGHQVCPMCGYDDDITEHLVDDEWVMTCQNRSHPLFEWRPKSVATGLTSYRSGLGEELGVYDDLLACVDGVLSEYGVIEYRFAERSRQAYDFLVN